MEGFFKYATEQYDLVRESRKVLLGFCKTISADNFAKENSLFGNGGSIRNLFVHIANAYEFWITTCGLNKNIVFTKYESKENIRDIIDLFDTIDISMVEFIQSFKNREIKRIYFEIDGVKNNADSFKLFSHVITHEFYHKGQILSVSRLLGYIPIDTDIIR